MENKSKTLLEVRNLETRLKFDDKTIYAVNDISFIVEENETVAIIGESGSGKSMTAKSIMRLLPGHDSEVNGEILFNGEDLLKLSDMDMRFIRGHKISNIYQEPMNSLNPCLKIGYQIKESLLIHGLATGAQAKEMVIEMLKKVEIPDPEKRYHAYPHELSGGMQQRVLIAMALITNPALLIADEPTTALDVTVQAGIIKLLEDLKEQYNMSILLITHDLGVVSEVADRVIVMYGGTIMEIANIEKIYETPLHPYTNGLIKCIPKLDEKKDKLYSIEGHVLDLSQETKGCEFCARCDKRLPKCSEEKPVLREHRSNHYVRCWHYGK